LSQPVLSVPPGLPARQVLPERSQGHAYFIPWKGQF
jgi:hypothetical protein